MTKEQKQKIHMLYGIAVSIVAVIAGICLMVACVGIYRGGAFSREAVAQAFAPIAVPVYLCLALVIGGFILDAALPYAGKKKPEKQPGFILRRLREKTDLSLCDSALCQALLQQCESRRRCTIICAVINGIAAVVFLVYALNGSNFHRSEINESMIRAMYLFLPCLAVSFGSAVFCLYHNRKSIEKEIELLRQAKGCTRETAPLPRQKSMLPWQAALIIVAVILIVVGYTGGGFRDVLTKAVNICTECIGLG